MSQEHTFRVTCADTASRDATGWVVRFYPDIVIHTDGDQAELLSPNRSRSELRLIWGCALSNERLLDANRGMRAQVMQELMA